VTANDKAGLVGLAWRMRARAAFMTQASDQKHCRSQGLKVRVIGNPMFVDMAMRLR